jgi:acetylornithine deacetylase/succinyl-diaminopimelate desuccinylase-like protein
VTDDELERLYALLAIPSVSALPEHIPDMALAADAVAAEIRLAGGEPEVLTTGGHPLVVGTVPASAGNGTGPRVIVYGHYDVQPAGDPGLWHSPPFAPTVRGDHLYCRGASDDKGNLFMLLAAVRRLAQEGRLGVDVAFLIDGEEENGGTSAVDHLAVAPSADAAVIFDAPMIDPGRPGIYLGVRGLLYRRVRLRTGGIDAHSGVYGGAAMNAVHELVRLLGRVIPERGRMPAALREGAEPPTDAERAAWSHLPDGEAMLAEGGARPADPAAVAEFHERTTALPALDVNGIAAGEPHAVKTVIPAEAVATLSMRLAPGQRAEVMDERLDALLRGAAAPGCEVEIERLGSADPALVDPAHPMIRAAVRGLEAATGMPVSPVRTGGTIPIVAAFGARGIPVVLSGFGLGDDAIHAPNERLRFDHLELGARAAMGMLRAMGDVRPGAPDRPPA